MMYTNKEKAEIRRISASVECKGIAMAVIDTGEDVPTKDRFDTIDIAYSLQRDAFPIVGLNKKARTEGYSSLLSASAIGS